MGLTGIVLLERILVLLSVTRLKIIFSSIRDNSLSCSIKLDENDSITSFDYLPPLFYLRRYLLVTLLCFVRVVKRAVNLIHFFVSKKWLSIGVGI